MKDFAELTGNTYTGQKKNRDEIRESTRGKIAKPADYQYGKKLPEWDATVTAGDEDVLERCEPRKDYILVRLVPDPAQAGAIILTEKKELISGDVRKAIVLKTGPGRWMPGESFAGKWISGWRRPMQVQPGQTVLIGNWVDLEANGLCLCQEADVRVILN